MRATVRPASFSPSFVGDRGEGRHVPRWPPHVGVVGSCGRVFELRRPLFISQVHIRCRNCGHRLSHALRDWDHAFFDYARAYRFPVLGPPSLARAVPPRWGRVPACRVSDITPRTRRRQFILTRLPGFPLRPVRPLLFLDAIATPASHRLGLAAFGVSGRSSRARCFAHLPAPIYIPRAGFSPASRVGPLRVVRRFGSPWRFPRLPRAAWALFCACGFVACSAAH